MLVLFHLLLGGCTVGPVGPDDVRVTEGAVSTVLRVAWITGVVGTSWVEHGPPGQVERRTASGASGTTHDIPVYGVPAGEAWVVRPVTETADGTLLEGEEVEVEVSPPPPGLVELETQTFDPALMEPRGFVLTTQFGTDGSWAVIYDRDGRVVWHHTVPDGAGSLSSDLDGDSVVYQVNDRKQSEDLGAVVRVSLDGEEEVLTRSHQAHHDFTLLPDGEVAWLSLDVREAEVEGEVLQVTGDVVLAAPEGSDGSRSPQELFNFFDDYGDPWPASPEFDDEAYNTGGRDWTHANSLVYRAEDDALLVMSRNLDALLAVDRASGEVRWQLGGEHSDFTVDGTLWDHGHFSDYRDGRLLVFDNGDHRDPPASRVVEYEVDEEALTAREVWSTSLGVPPLFVPVLGDARRLPGGNTLISWSSFGLLTEVAPDGHVVWEGTTPIGAALGRVHYLAEVDPRLPAEL